MYTIYAFLSFFRTNYYLKIEVSILQNIDFCGLIIKHTEQLSSLGIAGNVDFRLTAGFKIIPNQ